MKTIDLRFSSNTIKDLEMLINHEFKMIRHDPFVYGPGVYGVVGIFIGDKTYEISNQIEVLDYYGTKEDVAVFRLEATVPEKIVSRTNSDMIDYPINSMIKEIHIVNENQQLFRDGTQIYDVHIVRGIIFVLQDDREISFEKPVWFSEDIYIEKGYNLYEKFAPTDSFLEDWDEGYTAKCERDIIRLVEK